MEENNRVMAWAYWRLSVGRPVCPELGMVGETGSFQRHWGVRSSFRQQHYKLT